ncbi:hypothetical protein F1D05_09110 [Kribbella qitaiheensis]|uniref:Uncharacterized protein n=1 Tax=Kribbella qitaiheensis TaxID=1544730 RepID=A0A7G6WVK0_9ACTN|nr:hypothetical protein [Kribbella qitaiheensis]QNE18015.1 hypothetical protein F1D05_09110 [Kribbella qitaiheensis]
MQFKSQFVPWRTAVGAAIVSVLALTCAGIAHDARHGGEQRVDHAVVGQAVHLQLVGQVEPVTAQFDLRK